MVQQQLSPLQVVRLTRNYITVAILNTPRLHHTGMLPAQLLLNNRLTTTRMPTHHQMPALSKRIAQLLRLRLDIQLLPTTPWRPSEHTRYSPVEDLPYRWSLWILSGRRDLHFHLHFHCPYFRFLECRFVVVSFHFSSTFELTRRRDKSSKPADI